jgi:succinate dehydrogenase / fumarate reductase cytochrome b subunit
MKYQSIRKKYKEEIMGWLARFYQSSVGKKSVMAASGILLVLFLLSHLLGNTTAFFGRNAFNSYAERLHSMGNLIYIFEIGLLTIFIIHIITGISLYLENLKARPFRYSVNKDAGGRTLGSRSMPYTGLLILIFILVHLNNFHFTDKSVLVADMVRSLLSKPVLAGFYVFSLVGVALHVSHGFWSMFQSLGLNHPKYNRLIKTGGLTFSIVVGTVFIMIPLLAVFSKSFLL